jgi:hypothetical protein
LTPTVQPEVLHLLLDEHISHVIADQLTAHRPDIAVMSLRDWEKGVHLEADDDVLLGRAYEQRLTLVTYDQQTIPPLIKAWADEGRSHAGIVFVDGRTIPSYDFGGLIRALSRLWDEQASLDWTDRVVYLRPTLRP